MLGTFLFLVACAVSFYVGRFSPEPLPRNPDAYLASLLLSSCNGVHWKEGISGASPISLENVTDSSTGAQSNNGSVTPPSSTEHSSGAEPGEQPVPIHMVQVGKPRTATTVQSKIMCISLFFKLLERDDNEGLARNLTCAYSKKPKRFSLHRPIVLKTHGAHEQEALDKVILEPKKQHIWVFSTAKTKEEAKSKRGKLQSRGYNVKYVQDLETLGVLGHQIVQKYSSIFHLNDVQTSALIEYMRYWDILRVCCGAQMSAKWRNELLPEGKKQSDLKNDDVHSPTYHACIIYDMDAVEKLFRSTTVYNLLEHYPNMKRANHLSEKDGELFGSYCSKYNNMVRERGIGFNKKVRIQPLVDKKQANKF